MQADRDFVDLNGLRADVERAVLVTRAGDWSLEVTLTGPVPRLMLSGTFSPARPAGLRIAFIDQPEEVLMGGVAGGLTNGGRDSYLELRRELAFVRLEGTVTLEWFGFERGSAAFVLSLSLQPELSPVEAS